MNEIQIELPMLTCPKCGYTWTPRVQNPKVCPRCGKRLEREAT